MTRPSPTWEPTDANFLELARVKPQARGMQPIQGTSLTDIFYSTKSPTVNPQRDHVLIGKERHDIGRPHDWGYPIRGIAKGGFLYLKNFETSRWPACNPETGYLNCDGSPTKTECLKARTQPGMRKFWQWSFGKRVAEELYKIDTDPECITNLADDPQYKNLKDQLKAQLVAELREQGDPRMFGRGRIFDEYKYSFENQRGFYEKFTAGNKIKAGWINPSDIETVPLD